MTKEKTAWELAGDAEGNDVGGDGARGCDEVRSGKLLALRTRKRGDAAADARVRAAAEWRLGKRRAARQKREDEPHQAGRPLAGGHVGHPARLAGPAGTEGNQGPSRRDPTEPSLCPAKADTLGTWKKTNPE